MIIISHDRHFLNQVCTHIADLDYRQLTIYPGNYDDFMLASVQARARVEASNAKAKDRISDLQEFVRRFSANASKSRQATSRKQQLEKIKLEDIKPSSRQNPYIRFEQGKKLYRSAFTVEKLQLHLSGLERAGAEEHQLHRRGRRAHRHHRPEWHRQDHADALSRRGAAPTAGRSRGWKTPSRATCRRIPRRSSTTRSTFLLDVQLHGQGDDEQIVRATLGRLLFSGDETKKSVGAFGRREGPHDLRQAHAHEAQRAADGRTHQPHGHGNHRVPADRPGELSGTLVFVSHDREFVGGLATRIIELRPAAASPTSAAPTMST